MRCPQHYLMDMQEVILFYKGLEVPTRQILDSKGVIPTMTAADAKVAIQEMAEHFQKWQDGTSNRTRSTETSDGLAAIQAQLNNLGREIKKVNEKVYVAQVGCELCKGPPWCELCKGHHYTKDCPLKKDGNILEEAYYTQFGVPFPQGGQYRAVTPGFYQRNNGNPSYQERRKIREESLSKFMAESAKIHEENSYLIKEIRASMDAAIRNQGSSIKALEIQIGQMSKVLKERGFGNLPSSTEMNPKDHVKSISTTVETDMTSIRRIRPSRYAVSVSQNSKLFFVPRQATIPFPSRLYDDCCDEEEGSYELNDLDAYSIGTTLLDDALPTKEKDLGSFTLPCIINNLYFNNALADLGVSVNVMPFSTYTKLGVGELAPTKLIIELADRTVKHPKGIAENVLVRIDKFVFPVDLLKITLRVGNNKVVFKSDKPASNIIKRVYALSLTERMELDLELRRNQVDDLEPTIEEGEVVDEPMMDIVKTRYDNEIVNGLDEHPSYCDFDRKFHIDYAYNLQFSCMIGYEHVNANFFPLLSTKVMSKFFYKSIMKDKVDYKGKNIVGAFMNVPIFVGNFSVMTDFVVVKNMDSYRDEEMGDIIIGRPFCKDACIKARRFDGMITIYKGNDSVTYQMARSHPRFKHLTNAQCNKMRPLLKVSTQDELKGISHPFQKLKGFYKEVLNLGPQYIKDDKVEEWLTRGHTLDTAYPILMDTAY
ncbi:ribonuclease H-like domain, reverse transcriptase, RNA-dependent DNA polymerase [Tanacetum coccineum]